MASRPSTPLLEALRPSSAKLKNTVTPGMYPDQMGEEQGAGFGADSLFSPAFIGSLGGMGMRSSRQTFMTWDMGSDTLSMNPGLVAFTYQCWPSWSLIPIRGLSFWSSRCLVPALSMG